MKPSNNSIRNKSIWKFALVNLAVLGLSIFTLYKAFDKNYENVSKETKKQAVSYERVLHEKDSLKGKIRLIGEIMDAEMGVIYSLVESPDREAPDSLMKKAMTKKELLSKQQILEELKELDESIDNLYRSHFDNNYKRIKTEHKVNIKVNKRAGNDVEEANAAFLSERKKRMRSGPGSTIGTQVEFIKGRIEYLSKLKEKQLKDEVPKTMEDFKSAITTIEKEVNKLLSIE